MNSAASRKSETVNSAALRMSEKLADPTWYRISYSLAAQKLHAANGTKKGPDGLVKSPDKGASAAVKDMADLRSSVGVSGKRGFKEAEDDALEVIRVTAAVLADMGWRWAGRNPSWYVSWSERLPAALLRLVRRLRRKPRRRSIAGDWPLAKFLDRTVEPAAVLLVWSARIERRVLKSLLRRELRELENHLIALAENRAPERRPNKELRPDRRQYAEGGGGDWLFRYVIELADDRDPEHDRWKRFVAWLGVSRYRLRGKANYRVQYELACLFSRLAQKRPGADGKANAAVIERAREHLGRSLSELPEPRRTEAADWATRDPSLVGLRDADMSKFDQLVGVAGEQTPIGDTKLRSRFRIVLRLLAPAATVAATVLIVVGRIADVDHTETAGWILLGVTALISVGAGIKYVYDRVTA